MSDILIRMLHIMQSCHRDVHASKAEASGPPALAHRAGQSGLMHVPQDLRLGERVRVAPGHLPRGLEPTRGAHTLSPEA